tara:strand:+ start:14487 stop:15377 length:891 start_codon:yes stop_codon:yes gene_type:complete
MPLFKPFGNFANEVIDPEKLSDEWKQAKKVVDSAGSWQFNSNPVSGLTYSSLAENGAGVRTHQKQRYGFAGAGTSMVDDVHNMDGVNLKKEGSAWLIPYMRGFKEVWDGDLAIEWTSDTPELVLIGYSCWAYRLSSKDERDNNLGYYSERDPDATLKFVTYGLGDDGVDRGFYFPAGVHVRTQIGMMVDGAVVDGSGPGTNVATNGPESVVGAGSREKGIVTSSTSTQILRAGTHRVSIVAGQGPASKTSNSDYYEGVDMKYYLDDYGDSTPNYGVAILNARVFVVRFPRGKMLGA